MTVTQQEAGVGPLKACPFCGEPMSPMFAEIRTDGELKGFDVTCYDCNGCGPVRQTKAEAAEAWNTRAPDPACNSFPKLVEALEDFCAAAEYWAGCDEGVCPDDASSEIMSSGGAWPAQAYDKARAALSLTKGDV